MPGKNSMPIGELRQLLTNGHEDFLREMLTKMLNLMMELEVSAKNEATKYERTEMRKAYRNGSRERTLSTGVGEVILKVQSYDREKATTRASWSHAGWWIRRW